MAAIVTDNIDEAVYWGMVEGGRGNEAAMQAQIDYVLATEQFAVENGYEIGPTTRRCCVNVAKPLI